MFDISWNYPEANLMNEVIFNNISAFYSKTKVNYEWPKIIHYQGPGNITAKNLNFGEYYSSYDVYKPTVFITTSREWTPNDNIEQLFTFDEATFSIQNYPFSIPLINGVEMSFLYSIHRK